MSAVGHLKSKELNGQVVRWNRTIDSSKIAILSGPGPDFNFRVRQPFKVRVELNCGIGVKPASGAVLYGVD